MVLKKFNHQLLAALSICLISLLSIPAFADEPLWSPVDTPEEAAEGADVGAFTIPLKFRLDTYDTEVRFTEFRFAPGIAEASAIIDDNRVTVQKRKQKEEKTAVWFDKFTDTSVGFYGTKENVTGFSWENDGHYELTFSGVPVPENDAKKAAENMTKDNQEIASEITGYAEQGDIQAKVFAAYRYASGNGVERDFDKAISLLEEAADAGNATAQRVLGYAYTNGTLVNYDFNKAFELTSASAAQGNIGAECNLGELYEKGYGVEKDEAEAMKWYQKAADSGNRVAMYRIAKMYEKGVGVEKNTAEAEKWFKAAIERGMELAEKELGYMQEREDG